MKLKIFLNSRCEHSAMVNCNVRNITDADLTATAVTVGVCNRIVIDMIEQVQYAIFK